MIINPKNLSLQDAAGMQLVELIRKLNDEVQEAAGGPSVPEITAEDIGKFLAAGNDGAEWDSINGVPNIELSDTGKFLKAGSSAAEWGAVKEWIDDANKYQVMTVIDMLGTITVTGYENYPINSMMFGKHGLILLQDGTIVSNVKLVGNTISATWFTDYEMKTIAINATNGEASISSMPVKFISEVVLDAYTLAPSMTFQEIDQAKVHTNVVLVYLSHKYYDTESTPGAHIFSCTYYDTQDSELVYDQFAIDTQNTVTRTTYTISASLRS